MKVITATVLAALYLYTPYPLLYSPLPPNVPYYPPPLISRGIIS